METRKKILKLANKISMESKSGFAHKVTDPEYRILDPVVTDDMADVAMGLKLRTPRTAKEVAEKCGKSEEETTKLLWQLAEAGVCTFKSENGVDLFWLPIWVPGIMEMMVNNKENVKKYPVIAECFEEYTRIRTAPLAPLMPTGKSMMRVIPVEQAINGESRRASYEEISRYLNDNDLFSVSDCSCRTSREAMGEGCGHLKEDMCVQIGEGAEFYIRTGRARQITREEAFEIIKKAEENGLVHQIVNTEGSGKTHAICNCCGCSCFSLRLAELYQTPAMLRSNYVSKVDKDKCVACGECVQTCQVNALKLGQSLCTRTPIVQKERQLPENTMWGKKKWNINYRTNRENVVETGTSPCKTECPAHIAIQGYIKMASQGKYMEALELIKHENPFPAICGRICSKKCESACTRGDIDDPIAIDEIKKFIAEQDLNLEHRYVPKKRHEYGKKIAVIGAGPAGLSCAFYLAIDGYKVTVFEKQKVLGGMLTLGIPAFRLEKDVVNAEIDILKEMGVEFKTGVEVGKDVKLRELRTQEFKAFYIAIGAQAARNLGIEGEDARGVITGVDFLRNVNLGNSIKLQGKVIVIGGGNVAIDVARSATRVGASEVDMFCLETREQMPALDEEIEEARSEDITINNCWGPKRIVTKNGIVVGVEFKKCTSVFDVSGKFNPAYDENDTKFVEANTVLTSVGQAVDWGNLIADSRIELNPNKTIKADDFTYQTGEADVFTGGDVYTGPQFAIDAIAAGKEAAISIHRFVQPGQSLVIGRDRREYRALDKTNATFSIKDYDNTPRQKPSHADGSISKVTFNDLRCTFTEDQVKKETDRCLSCGATIVDEYTCVGCGICTTKCNFDAISLVRRENNEGVAYEKLITTQVVPYAIKRGGKIVAKKVKNMFS